MIHLKILFSISKTLGLLSYRPGFQQVEISMKDNIRIPLNLKLWVQPGHFGLSKSINQQAKKVTPIGGNWLWRPWGWSCCHKLEYVEEWVDLKSRRFSEVSICFLCSRMNRQLLQRNPDKSKAIKKSGYLEYGCGSPHQTNDPDQLKCWPRVSDI